METVTEGVSKVPLQSVLREALAYLASHFPKETELSRSRLTRMLYLADWRSAILRGQPLTKAVWNYSQYGPFAIEAETILRHDPNFTTSIDFSLDNGEVDTVALRQPVSYTSLTVDDRSLLDFVVEVTASLPWNDFNRLVYSTYPLITQEKYQNLDLMVAADRYQRDGIGMH